MKFLSIKFLNYFAIIFNIVQGCPIYITISLKERQWLQINWGPGCNNNAPDLIALYQKDPSLNNLKHDILIKTNHNSSGTYVTDFLIENIKFPSGWEKRNNERTPSTIVKYSNGKCLNYYLGAYYRDENTNRYDMSVNCLKIQPNWMTLMDHVPKIPLKNLFIPGTHSSGAYPPGSQTRSILVKNFGYAQNFDVWTQLVFGIRYLDLKIGHRKNLLNNTKSDGTNFWIVNENMFINPLKSIVTDIREFLIISGEVVIVDFSDFPIGFSNEPKRHTEFLEYIQNEFESFAYGRDMKPSNIQNSYDLTVDEIRSKNKNLLILYPIEELISGDVNKFNFIWPSWKKFTTSNLNSDDALDFMRLLFSKKESSPIQDEGWIFHGIRALEESYNSNQKLLTTKERAETINSKINSWLSGPWSLTANIVTVDFFLNTNLIDLAMQVNAHKALELINGNLTKIEM